MKNIQHTILLNDGWKFSRYSCPVHTEVASNHAQYWSASFPQRDDNDHVSDTTQLAVLVKDSKSYEWYPAQVPGSIHYDLMREGFLENPFASAQAAKDAWWVSESDWLFRLQFDLLDLENFDKSLSRIILEFNGIDTFSDIWFNEYFVGTTENAYRRYSFELPFEFLRNKNNEIIVHVKAHGRVIQDKIPKARRMNLSGPTTGLLGKSLIRRYQRSFFSNSSLLNLGTGVLGIGLNNDVKLHVFSKSRVSEVYVRTTKLSKSLAAITVRTDIDYKQSKEVHGNEYSLVVTAVSCDSDESQYQKIEQRFTLNYSTQIETNFEISNPKLWWPTGYGEPNLYKITISLLQGNTTVDSRSILYGFRSVELVTETGDSRPCFYFRVNGEKIHCRGYNLLPPDYIKVHGTNKVYQQLFSVVQNSGANMLRFWGGGAVENEEFYETCDKLGLMVWQDFFLHSNVYPDYDEDFVNNFACEAKELVKKIRNHPCLTILCGGNEQYEGWEEWGWKEEMDRFYGEPLVTEMLRDVSQSLCPDVPYIINSPHGYPRAQSPVSGDMHNWGNFFNSTKDPQFVTETCWSIESYSRPETLLKVMNLDVDEYNGPGWYEHWNKITGLPKIIRFHYSSYFDVKSLRGYLHSLEIEQAFADYFALSNLRLRSSSCSGILYWSLNKGGPLFQFGCIDYLGYPMMSYYITKRLYAGVVIQLYRDIDDVRIIGSNETLDDVPGILNISHIDVEGVIKEQWQMESTLEKGSLTRLFDLPGYYSHIKDRLREVIQIEFIIDGSVVAEDFLFFAPFAEVQVNSHPMEVLVTKTSGNRWKIKLEAKGFVKMVEMECDGRPLYSDNYFAMAPGKTKHIELSALDAEDVPTVLTVSAIDSSFKESFAL